LSGGFSEVPFVGLPEILLGLFDGCLDLPEVLAYVLHGLAAISFEGEFVGSDEGGFLLNDVEGLLEVDLFVVEFDNSVAGFFDAGDTGVPVPGGGVEGFPSSEAARKLPQVMLEGLEAAHGHEPFFGGSAFFCGEGVPEGAVGGTGSAILVGVDGEGVGGGGGRGGGIGGGGFDGDVVGRGSGFAGGLGVGGGLHLIGKWGSEVLALEVRLLRCLLEWMDDSEFLGVRLTLLIYGFP
jgi:hypothetical protein